VTYNLQRGIQYAQIRHHLATVPLLRHADIIAVQEALVPAGGRNTLARLADELEGALSLDIPFGHVLSREGVWHRIPVSPPGDTGARVRCAPASGRPAGGGWRG